MKIELASKREVDLYPPITGFDSKTCYRWASKIMAEPFFAAENQYSATKLSQNRSGFDHAVKEKLAVAEYT